MAYNPNLYMPGYNPAYGYNQQAPIMPPINGLISVAGREGAKAYANSMPPNSSAAVFDENEDVFFVVKTDGAGYPTIKDYSFAPLQHEEKTPDFVTRQEFDELLKRIDALAQPTSASTSSRRKKSDSDGE